MGEGSDFEEEPVLAPMQMAADEGPAAGPPEWLGKLFIEHHDRIYRAAYRVSGNAMDAEDVLQTVFLRLARRDPALPLLGNIGSYLHLAAVNGALDLVRARAAAKSTPLEEVEGRLAGEAGDSPEGAHAGGELRERLCRALSTVSPRTAEIFVLRYFEGYGNREIARMLNISQGVVAVVLHRARRKLRDEIGKPIGGRS